MTTNLPPQEAVLYIRVSSDDQSREGYSPAAQRDLLMEYAQKKDLHIVKEFNTVESASSTGRRGFNEMMEFLRKSKTCRVLLVEKVDRLVRNLKDYVAITDLKIEIHFVKENQILTQNSSPSEWLMNFFMLGVAVVTPKNLSAEVHKGMRKKAELGMYPSSAPIGYLNHALDSKRRVLIPDPDTAETVKRAFEWYSTGRMTLTELTQKLADMGLGHRHGRKLSRSEVHYILRRRLYCGEFDWNGKTYSGTYEALVSKDLWSKVNTILDGREGRGKGIQNRIEFSYAGGLIKCGYCGCAMVAELKKGRYRYYHCSFFKARCPGRYVREERLDEEFTTVLKSLSFGDDVMSLVADSLRLSRNAQREFTERAIARLQDQHRRLQQRIDSMYDDRLNGVIDTEMFMRRSQELRTEQSRTLQQIESLQEASQMHLVDGVKLLDLARKAHTLFLEQDAAQKRRLLGFVVSNCSWKDDSLHVELRQPFDRLRVAVASTSTSDEAPLGPKRLEEKWSARQESNLRPTA